MRSTRYIQVTPARPKVGSPLRDAGPTDTFADERTVRGVRYTGDEVGFENAYAMEISGCVFSGVRLVAELNRTTVDNCEFTSADISNVRADESSLLESTLALSRLTGISLTDGVVRDVEFSETRADLSVFRNTKFRNVVFTGCNLTGSDFQRATLRNVRFEKCDLTGAQFSNAIQEHNVSFEDCRLIDINGVRGLKGARVRGDDLLGLAGSLAREVGIDVDW
ncbi:pentapeptide repeat-containing protein [Nocardia sp. NPDC005366]|uniref:pentapeptide repeat-containing protein n=1 Tax=Nocardia sp. NPDC005366 TaxID=3156878 RepID=UPI0033A1F3F6